MGTYLKKAGARKCPVHSILIDRAKADIEMDGYFSKARVLAGPKSHRKDFTVMGDAVQWGVIRGCIEEDLNQELTPITKVGLLDADLGQSLKPAHIAGGTGKNTYGFASLEERNKQLVIARFDRKLARTNGGAAKVVEMAEKAKDHGVDGLMERTGNIERVYMTNRFEIEQEKKAKLIESRENEDESGSGNPTSPEDG